MGSLSRPEPHSARSGPGQAALKEGVKLLAPALLSTCTNLAAVSLYYVYKRYSQRQPVKQLLQQKAVQWSISTAKLSQLDAIVDQVYSAFGDHFRSTNSAAVDRSTWYNVVDYMLSSPQHYAYLAADDATNEVIGSVFGLGCDADIAPLGPFSVLSEHASQGIARKLVQRLIDECLRGNAKRPLTLAQSPDNIKAFALYTSLGFRVEYSVIIMRGFVSKLENVVSSDIIEVKRFAQSDVDEATELLKTTLSGISRRNYITSMLSSQINKLGIGYVARDKYSKQLVGFTTAANTEDGIWCYNKPKVFEALYLHAHRDLQTFGDLQSHVPLVWMSASYEQELRWLLRGGVKGSAQWNVMVRNKLDINAQYRYCPSACG